MRVTNKMISDQVISNLTRSLDQFMNLQVQMSTGRRLNKPSDDPVGIQKDLSYRGVLTNIAQFKRNIASGGSLLSSYDNILGSMKDIVQSANELAVSLSNDTYDEVARNAAADEVEALYSQLVDLANSTREGRYIFSGHLTRDAAIETTAHGAIYAGDSGQTRIEIEDSSKIGINILGADLLFQPLTVLGEDADLKIGVADSTLLADLHTGAGIDLISGTNPGQFIITDNNLGLNITIDLSGLPADPTLGQTIAEINTQLTAAGVTNLTVGYGPEGNNLRWVATDSGIISNTTALRNLNGGAGIDLSAGKIRLHNADDSINFEVDLSDATTVGELINAFNANPDVAALGISMAISADGKGLTITDPLPLEGIAIEDISEYSTTAVDLGLLMEVDAASVQGADLNPIADFSAAEAAAGQTVLADLGLAGNFNNIKIGNSLNPRMTVNDSVNILGLGHGLDLGEIRIAQGRSFINLDLGDPAIVTIGDIIDAINNSGLNIVASINNAGTGIQIESTSNVETLIISEWGDGTSAHDLGIYGSSDILGTLSVLSEALRNNDGKTAGQLIGNLDEGINQLLNLRAAVGAKVIRLESADKRLTNLAYDFTELLSEVEDADLTRLVTDLAMKENNYQAALIAAAKIIQPSLLDFCVDGYTDEEGIMRITTLRFGEIEIPDDKIIHMAKPVLGFEQLKDFCIIEGDDFEPFLWFQSVDEPSVAFIIVNPLLFSQNYRIEVNPREIEELRVGDVKTVETYVIVSIPADPQKMSINLQGPILINTRTRLAKQLVLVNTEYEVKHYIFDDKEESLSRTKSRELAGTF